MSETKIAGIMRASVFSPNHIGNDAAIFNATVEQLRKRGVAVKVYNEEQLAAGLVHERVVLDMCREPRSIEILEQMEDDGVLVVNSGYGIYNCTRERMTRILQARGIPVPRSIIAATNESVIAAMTEASMERAWVKRGDYHARHKEDICFVRHPREAQEVMQEYFLRGIPRAVINSHIDGDLIKFYGVSGSTFFRWIYPHETHICGEHESVNGAPVHTGFDAAALERVCRQAADSLGVTIWGGDCVVRPDGTFVIIDFKDWPSFAPCRAEAAPVIARRLLAMIKEHSKR